MFLLSGRAFKATDELRPLIAPCFTRPRCRPQAAEHGSPLAGIEGPSGSMGTLDAGASPKARVSACDEGLCLLNSAGSEAHWVQIPSHPPRYQLRKAVGAVPAQRKVQALG